MKYYIEITILLTPHFLRIAYVPKKCDYFIYTYTTPQKKKKKNYTSPGKKKNCIFSMCTFKMNLNCGKN